MTSDRIFDVKVLMAGHGDCLWIEYGDRHAPTRVMVDGGTATTFQKLKPMLDAVRNPIRPSHALLVISHVDTDHISGALPILASPLYSSQFAEVWFNGRQHLESSDSLEILGPRQGELLTESIVKHGIKWNAAFDNKSVAVSEDGELRATILPGGAKVTILSPGRSQLREMAKVWDKEIERAGLKRDISPERLPAYSGFEVLGAGGPNIEQLAVLKFDEDTAPANGSSIAMLIELEGKRLLLGADAHPSVLAESIVRLTGGSPLEVDVFKLPHHGSKHNVNWELLQTVRAKNYVFSSNGAYFGHPDQEAVAKVIKYGGTDITLVFNSKTNLNKVWAASSLLKTWKYNVIFGDDESGVILNLLS